MLPHCAHRVDRKRGVFRRRADQHQNAAFDVGKEDVLLLLVEAVNLVHEKHGCLARLPELLLRLLRHGADLLDPCGAAGERARGAVGVAHDDGGHGRLAAAWGTEENDGGGRVLLEKGAQDRSRAEQIVIAL